MRLSDRYVFSELLLPFFIGTSAVLMMMVGTTLYALLPGMIQMHWPAAIAFRVCILAMPAVLVQALPISTALAISLATNRMARDNEITVMRSAGVPLLRIFLPMILFSVLISGLDFYIADQVKPWAVSEQQNVAKFLVDNIGTSPVEIGHSFPIDGYNITFQSAKKQSESVRRLNKVIIIVPPKPGSNDFSGTTTAEYADYNSIEGVWHLHNVVYHHYGPDGMTLFDVAAPTGSLKLQMDLSSIGQLDLPGQEDNFSTAQLIAREAIARRTGNIRDAKNLEVARWFKLSFSAMCVSLALCCPPLGLRFARTGTFTGVLLSIITCFIAWNTLLPAKMIAEGGYLPAIPAAWFTNILFAGLGLWLFRKQE